MLELVHLLQMGCALTLLQYDMVQYYYSYTIMDSNAAHISTSK